MYIRRSRLRLPPRRRGTGETSVERLDLAEGDVGESLHDLLCPRFERLACPIESFSPSTLALLHAFLPAAVGSTGSPRLERADPSRSRLMSLELARR